MGDGANPLEVVRLESISNEEIFHQTHPLEVQVSEKANVQLQSFSTLDYSHVAPSQHSCLAGNDRLVLCHLLIRIQVDAQTQYSAFQSFRGLRYFHFSKKVGYGVSQSCRGGNRGSWVSAPAPEPPGMSQRWLWISFNIKSELL